KTLLARHWQFSPWNSFGIHVCKLTWHNGVLLDNTACRSEKAGHQNQPNETVRFHRVSFRGKSLVVQLTSAGPRPFTPHLRCGRSEILHKTSEGWHMPLSDAV